MEQINDQALMVSRMLASEVAGIVTEALHIESGYSENFCNLIYDRLVGTLMLERNDTLLEMINEYQSRDSGEEESV